VRLIFILSSVKDDFKTGILLVLFFGVAECQYAIMISHCWRRNSVTSLHEFYVFYKMYINIIHFFI